MTNVEGDLYLLCFDPPYKHARHYLGWAIDAEARIDEHRRGTSGAKLPLAAFRAGCLMHVAWVRRGTRSEERAIKNRRNLARDCSRCKVTRWQEAANG